MPNRSIRDEMQGDGRRKVGPADPETRQRMLKERLGEREPDRYGKGRERAPAKVTENPTRDLSAYGAARKIIARKARIDQAVDDAS